MADTLNIQTPRRRLYERLVLTAIVVAVGVFYYWTAWSCGATMIVPRQARFTGNSPDLHPVHYGYYNLLADAFLAGQTSLSYQSPEMQTLDNPYDPVKNQPYRLSDGSYYKGKYYLYFGPTPAVILFVPWRILGVGNMSEPLAAFLFAFGAFVVSLLLLRRLVRSYLPRTPLWIQAIAAVCAGLCNLMPFLLRMPIVYHVAIICGQCMLLAGLWLLFWGYEAPACRPVLWTLASLATGLGVGARPTVIFSAGAMVAVYLAALRRDYAWDFRRAWRETICLALPLGACLLMLGLYNHVRFDSWTEFGWRHLTNAVQMKNLPAFSADNLLPGLYFALWCPARLGYLFPFLHLRSGPSAYPGTLPAGYEGPEMLGGMLPNIPITFLLLAIPLVLWLERKNKSGLVLALSCLTGLGLATMTFVAYAVSGNSMRYLADSLPLLLLASLAAWFYLVDRIRRGWARVCLNVPAVILLLYGCLFSVCISMKGPCELLLLAKPKLYHSMELALEPVSNYLGRFYASPGGVDATFSLTEAPNDDPEKRKIWLSKDRPLFLQLHSPRPTTAKLIARMEAGEETPDSKTCHLRIQQQGYPDVILEMALPFAGTIGLPLDKGMNMIAIDVLESSTRELTDSFAPRVINMEPINLYFVTR